MSIRPSPFMLDLLEIQAGILERTGLRSEGPRSSDPRFSHAALPSVSKSRA